ncbi:hypothetical protein B0H15DRAFT_151783 [Mycena belliarum]|uniref:Uncharacterized protein n=1 Tax=Mycena belliarum TaxID=1033014 RepID=A0AAD6U8M3_9AGAR|nr:hypothetical protein B0H15DRAFT_151783 [Mycena belliae]
MFSFAIVLFSSLILPAACQFSGGDDDAESTGFHPDPLTAGTFALLCIFAVCYSVLIIWTFVALVTSRGHRAPYAFLLPALVFFAWSNATYIALIILVNIPAIVFSDDLPPLLVPALTFVNYLFNDWGLVLIFLAVIAVIWNRESALRAATEGKSGGHHPALIAVHATLAALVFILGTAAEGYNMETNVRYYLRDDDERRFLTRRQLARRIITYQQLFYAFSSFAILMGVDVIVSATLLWRAWKNAAISDKVTNIMLYVVAPLYGLLSLVIMIFTIVFSPSGLPRSAGRAAFESASLANVLLATGLLLAVATTLLVLALRKRNWTPGGAAPPMQQQPYWAPQPQQYTYAAPPPGTQSGYVHGHFPHGPPMAFAPGPGPAVDPTLAPQAPPAARNSYAYASGPSTPQGPSPYAPPRPGSYYSHASSHAPASPPLASAVPGGYTPPASAYGGAASPGGYSPPSSSQGPSTPAAACGEDGTASRVTR